MIVAAALTPGQKGWAQSDDPEVSITAAARPSEVGTAGTVRFEIRVKGVPLSAIQAPEPPATANLVLQESTPVTQRQLSFNSGRLQRRITFVWRYRPMRVGIGRIRPATLRIQGERYETQEVRVRIVPQSQASHRAPQGHAPAGGGGGGDASRPSRLGPRDLFIRATASADTAYQNEQVTAEYRLFYRPGIRLRRSRMADAWDAPGFWREELDVDARPAPETQTLRGETYKTIVLKRVALFPTRPGRLAVDPLRIETQARAQPQLDGRDEPIARSQYESITLASDTLVVQARPLPPDAPPTFDGAVGQFSLRAALSAPRVPVGTGIDLMARIEGRGNLATLSPPLVEAPAGLATYDPTVETQIDRSGAAVRGTKTFTFALVPEAGGRHTLPPVQFAYFDPEAGQYEVLRAGGAEIRATGTAGPQATSRAANGLPIGDIAGLMATSGEWGPTDRTPLYAQPWAYGAVALPVLLAVGGMAWRRRRRPEAPAPPDTSLPDARRHLETARDARAEGDARAVYDAVEAAVLGFLDRRLDLPRPAPRMTLDDLDRRLKEHDVPATERTALRTLLDTCHQMQFTPARPSDADLGDALDHARTLLRRLDDALPAAE
jgi:hypothetical protein